MAGCTVLQGLDAVVCRIPCLRFGTPGEAARRALLNIELSFVRFVHQQTLLSAVDGRSAPFVA